MANQDELDAPVLGHYIRFGIFNNELYHAFKTIRPKSVPRQLSHYNHTIFLGTMQTPVATYSSPDVDSAFFTVDPANLRYQTTNGRTTGPSPHVLNAGQIDRDKPSEPKKEDNGQVTALGQLRCHLTGLQDDINDFLTNQMELVKRKKTKIKESKAQEERIETEIAGLLDGTDDDSNN